MPFGWLPLRDAWKAGRVPFWQVLEAVAHELQLEWRRYTQAQAEGDFIRWLARRGYNANPQEWDAWEQNVRHFMKALSTVLDRP